MLCFRSVNSLVYEFSSRILSSPVFTGVNFGVGPTSSINKKTIGENPGRLTKKVN